MDEQLEAKLTDFLDTRDDHASAAP
jgi:hypothetical protein